MADRRENTERPPGTEVAAALAAMAGVLGPDGPGRWILVSTDRQRLWLMDADRPARDWPVSTAAAGTGSAEDSGRTPTGVHVIDRKIGGDQPIGAVFVSREPTGEIRRPGDPPRPGEDDPILTRILTLDGREDGLNRGPGVDSRSRYIYIHGTADEARLGRPVSHGCIRMASTDVIALFERVEEGDPVVIV